MQFKKAIILANVCVSTLLSTLSAQTTDSIPPTLGKDLAAFLKPGKHIVHRVLPALPVISSREAELSAKMKKAVLKNAAWFRDSLGTIPDENTMSAKMGFTLEEWQEYQKITENKKAPATKLGPADTLTIQQKGSILSFKGAGWLGHLDSLTLELSANTWQYGQYQLTFDGKASTKNENPPFRNASGYEFSYKPKDGGPSAGEQILHDPAHMTFTIIRLITGKTEDKSQTVFLLVGVVNENGRLKSNFSVPLVMD